MLRHSGDPVLPQHTSCLATTKNYCGETTLHIACVKGNLELVRFLCAQGADVSAAIMRNALFFYPNPGNVARDAAREPQCK